MSEISASLRDSLLAFTSETACPVKEFASCISYNTVNSSRAFLCSMNNNTRYFHVLNEINDLI